MPTYRITDPNTGKTLKVTGDSPPTEAELGELFGGSVPTEAPALGAPGDGRQPSGALDSMVGTALTGGFVPAEAAQSIGRGAVDSAGRLALGAKQLMGMTSAEEAGELRPQLEHEGALETLGGLAPAGAIAASVPGGQGALADMGLSALVGGGLGAAESGNASDALPAAAMSGLGLGATKLLGKAGEALALRSVDKNLDRAMMPAAEKLAQVQKIVDAARRMGGIGGTVVGAVKGGPMGAAAGLGSGAALGETVGKPIADLMNSSGFNTLSANAKVKLLNLFRSGDAEGIARAVWRLLPATAESSASPTAADLAAEAKRRRDANTVLR